MKVERCAHWRQLYGVHGRHCFNYAWRDGYPFRTQPTSECKNFAPFAAPASDCHGTAAMRWWRWR